MNIRRQCTLGQTLLRASALVEQYLYLFPMYEGVSDPRLCNVYKIGSPPAEASVAYVDL